MSDLEKINMTLHGSMMEHVPSQIAHDMEQWIEKRCRLTGGRIDYFDLPTENSKVIIGSVPREVVDFFVPCVWGS